MDFAMLRLLVKLQETRKTKQIINKKKKKTQSGEAQVRLAEERLDGAGPRGSAGELFN